MNKNDLIRDRDVLKKYIDSLSKEEKEQHLLDYLEDAVEWNDQRVISIVEDQLKKPLEQIYKETLEEDKGLLIWQIALVIVLVLLIVRSA